MQADPIREWREQYARRCLRVDFEPLADTPFHASVKPIFPELRIVRAALSPGFLFRDDDLLRDGDLLGIWGSVGVRSMPTWARLKQP